MPYAVIPLGPDKPARSLSLSLGNTVARALGTALDGTLSCSRADVAAIAALLHPEERAFFAHAVEWAASQDAPARLSLRLARGTDRWVSVLAELRRGDDGDVQLAIELDDAAAARRSEAQIRQIVENARQAATVQQGARTVYTNHALASMLGYGSLAEMRRDGSGDLGHIHPDDYAMVRRYATERAADMAAPDSYEFRMLRTDGSVIWVDCSVSQVTWNGTPASLAWLIDVTERRRTEEALRRSEKLFHGVFQACPEIMTLSRLGDGRFVDVNNGFVRLHGHTRDEVIGRTERELGLFVDPSAAHRALLAGSQAGAAGDVIAAVNTCSGEPRQLMLSSQPIRLDGYDLLLTVGRDVTDRLRVEEELRKSREAAVFANRAKSEFLANMSHELRTPLNAIIGFSEVIAEGLFGPVGSGRYADYARDIQSSGEHLLQIINDLLDLSKLEAGKQPLDESDIALVDLAEASLLLVRQRAREANLALTLDIPDDLPAVHADERLLKQIMINLLSNAVKFTGSGGTITVRARTDADGGIELSVADTGTGMTAADIEVALSPFGQINSALARRHRGTGLGLPLVRSLIELHGGSLHVASEPGAGTTATVVIPPDRVLPPG